MPLLSQYPDFEIPNVGLWDFIFNRERDFPDDRLILQSVTSKTTYTFTDVRKTAKHVASVLQSRFSIAKGDVVSIFAANDVDVPPCIYGALYSGAVVSLANPAYSAHELGFMLKDSQSRLIFTQASLLKIAQEAAKVAAIPVDHIILLGQEPATNKQTRHFQDFEIKPDRQPLPVRVDPAVDLAFLVYSSGTTGLPKGVMLSHRNVISDILMLSHTVGSSYDGENDRILGVLPFFHIYGLTGLVHQALHRGIPLFVLDKFDLDSFCRAVQDHRITFTYVAPPVLVQLRRSTEAKSYNLSSMRMITCGAAPLTKELVDEIYQQYGIKVNQAYGLSETSPMTHTQPWDEWYSTVGSVGKLFPNMCLKIVDIDGEEVGTDTSGEIWLKGPNVFKGYWHRPKETEEAISPDGYFKTGDIGHIDDQGNCYITDRLKELIKYNGFQVAPAELEGLLLTNPLIRDVAVIGVLDAINHTELPRAYVVLVDGVSRDQETANSIVRWLETRVAYYKKLRGGVYFMDDIPKSASGKILRRVLKESSKRKNETRGFRPKL